MQATSNAQSSVAAGIGQLSAKSIPAGRMKRQTTIVLGLMAVSCVALLFLAVHHKAVPETWAWKSPLVPMEEVMKGPFAQDDPRVLNFIRNNNFLVPPSEAPYYLVRPFADPSMGQSSVVKKILENMKDGFFVECGALDGETRSNTLDLEKNYGWKGLLIEGDPKNVDLLIKKNRKAWVAKTCLATKPYPHQVFFTQNFNTGKISKDDIGSSSSSSSNEVQVQCFPLFSLLSVLEVKVVDYFSLDVEGLEYQVLGTIPFDKVLIKVLSVEYIHDVEGEKEIERFMKTKGYRVVTKVTNSNSLANDLILVHSSVEVTERIEPVNT